MVLLEAEQLLLQGLHLGLQVGPAQGQLIQDPAQAVDVRLNQLPQAQLHLVPVIGTGALETGLALTLVWFVRCLGVGACVFYSLLLHLGF